MDNYRDEVLARRLKGLLDARKISIKSAAEQIDVPYRTLQNQLMGNNRLTAATLAKLLALLELPIEAITTGRVRPPFRPIANALKKTLGALLPSVSDDLELLPPHPDRNLPEFENHARTLALLLRDEIEKETVRLEDWPVLLEAADPPPGVSK